MERLDATNFMGTPSGFTDRDFGTGFGTETAHGYGSHGYGLKSRNRFTGTLSVGDNVVSDRRSGLTTLSSDAENTVDHAVDLRSRAEARHRRSRRPIGTRAKGDDVDDQPTSPHDARRRPARGRQLQDRLAGRQRRRRRERRSRRPCRTSGRRARVPARPPGTTPPPDGVAYRRDRVHPRRRRQPVLLVDPAGHRGGRPQARVPRTGRQHRWTPRTRGPTGRGVRRPPRRRAHRGAIRIGRGSLRAEIERARRWCSSTSNPKDSPATSCAAIIEAVRCSPPDTFSHTATATLRSSATTRRSSRPYFACRGIETP